MTEVFRAYGLTAEESAPVVEALRKRPEAWVDFMMRFELGLEKPDPRRALDERAHDRGRLRRRRLHPAGALPLSVDAQPRLSLVSVVVTLVALALFGYVKGRFTGASPVRSALQTALIGGLAAAAAFGIARAIG